MSHNLQPRSVRRKRRQLGARRHLIGTPERPRLAVYRSLSHIYAQIIDDLEGKTLVATSSLQAKLPKGGNVEAAGKVGEEIAKKALASGIKKVAFDRAGFRYHGRVKALAESARKGGLEF